MQKIIANAEGIVSEVNLNEVCPTTEVMGKGASQEIDFKLYDPMELLETEMSSQVKITTGDFVMG